MAQAPAAVDPLDEIRTVLEQCGIATQAARNNLIANEGFTSIESMSCMTNDNDGKAFDVPYSHGWSHNHGHCCY